MRRRLNESVDVWDAYDKAIEMLGAEELCMSLAKAMGTAELEDNLRYIDRMYELDLWNEHEDEDEDEDMEESCHRRGRRLNEGFPRELRGGRDSKRYATRASLVNKALHLGAQKLDSREEVLDVKDGQILHQIAYSMDINGNKSGAIWYGDKDGQYYYCTNNGALMYF